MRFRKLRLRPRWRIACPHRIYDTQRTGVRTKGCLYFGSCAPHILTHRRILDRSEPELGDAAEDFTKPNGRPAATAIQSLRQLPKSHLWWPNFVLGPFRTEQKHKFLKAWENLKCTHDCLEQFASYMKPTVRMQLLYKAIGIVSYRQLKEG